MEDVPMEENLTYPNHSTKTIPSDNISTTNTLVKGNLSYISHSVGKTLGERPAQDREYEPVDVASYKQ